jgi:hypothetical protein
MAKYREKIPTMVVDINEWNPAKGLAHIAVATERTADGGYLGAIHKSSGESIFGIKPGTLVITYPTSPSATYAVIKAADVSAYFEPVFEAPDESLPALTEDTGAISLDDLS